MEEGWEDVGGECWDLGTVTVRALGDGDSWGHGVSWLPHVDLLLCRFSTERIVAWNILRLCTWIRPRVGRA